MNQEDILRVLQGLRKKHGNSFAVKLKYRTNSGKIRNRHGEFVDLLGEEELILFNRDKGKEGKYRIDHIMELEKRS